MNISLGIAIIAFGIGLYYLFLGQISLVCLLEVATKGEDKDIDEAGDFLKKYSKKSIICFVVSGIFFALAF